MRGKRSCLCTAIGQMPEIPLFVGYFSSSVNRAYRVCMIPVSYCGAPPRSCSCITIICNEFKSQPNSKCALTSKLTCAALYSDLKSMYRVCELTALFRSWPNDEREQKMVCVLDPIRCKSVMLNHRIAESRARLLLDSQNKT